MNQWGTQNLQENDPTSSQEVSNKHKPTTSNSGTSINNNLKTVTTENNVRWYNNNQYDNATVVPMHEGRSDDQRHLGSDYLSSSNYLTQHGTTPVIPPIFTQNYRQFNQSINGPNIRNFPNTSLEHSSDESNTTQGQGIFRRSYTDTKYFTENQSLQENLSGMSMSEPLSDLHIGRTSKIRSESISSNSSASSTGSTYKALKTKIPQKRSRMGCLTCRKRKKRCCETRPICTECNKLGLNCVWPIPGMEHKNKSKNSHNNDTIDHQIYGKIKVLRGIVEYRSEK